MDDSSMNKTIHEFLHGKTNFGEHYGRLYDHSPDNTVCKQIPGYTTDLNAVREAELKVIEKFGLEAYGKSLTNVIFNNNPNISEEDHAMILITAPASFRANAVYNIIENETKNQE